MNLHVQIFAQSLNASPNANIDIQYLDSEIYFSVNDWFIDEESVDDAAAANPIRAMGWGIITILGVAIIAKRLWDSMEDSDFDSEEESHNIGGPFVESDNNHNH